MNKNCFNVGDIETVIYPCKLPKRAKSRCQSMAVYILQHSVNTEALINPLVCPVRPFDEK